MRKSWLRALILLAIVDGFLSSVLDLKLQPERPNNVYYSLRGSTFVLNCTGAVGNYVQALNLTWQHNGKWLFGEVQHIDIAMVQLKLSNTSRDNDGIYWCGPKLGNTSEGVNISLTVADLPSPPRNLSYSVVGVMDLEREYRVYWSASSFTGGLPVNYSIKLCVNDSYAENSGTCKWSSNPDCRPANVLSTDKDFSCVLYARDFVPPCEQKCNYTISVVAENAVGSVTSWRYLPVILMYSVTPSPPLSFSVVTTDKQKELRVSWRARKSWKYAPTCTKYTILYHAKNEMENQTKIICHKNKLTEVTRLSKLKAFMEYYVYLVVSFVREGGKRSAPSEVQGPRIVKTPAGEPDTPSKVIRDWSVIFPDDPTLRNVTVEWKLAHNSSWHGTPGRHVICCNYHNVNHGSLRDCEYHVDATSSRAVLQRLNSAKRYNVFIKMCNKEKFCGRGGESYIIKELQDNTISPKNGGKPISKQIALITVSVVVGSITALVAVYWVRKWLHGRGISPTVRLRNRLTLQPPVQANYNYVDPVVTNDYDQLNFNESQL